ncbi:MAG: hypothetical protein WC516_07055 [Patescibacteria group bacterium]|jgi:hypothetical protein
MNGRIYKNKKKGTFYIIVGVAFDATNARDGNRVIVYKSCENCRTLCKG